MVVERLTSLGFAPRRRGDHHNPLPWWEKPVGDRELVLS
jgi:hypothetical protein